MKKISFIGDIMCEKNFLKASKDGKEYNFKPLFKQINQKIQESDLVIANLETVFAGREAGYSKEIFSFNSPDALLDEVTSSGISHVITANNHCLDRGLEGLITTISKIEDRGMINLGTFISKEARKPYEIIEVDGLKIALLAYTYCTNPLDNKVVLKPEDRYSVNMLKLQENEIEKSKSRPKYKTLKGRIFYYITKPFNIETSLKIKKLLGVHHKNEYVDVLEEGDLPAILINRLKEDIGLAKANSDYTIVCLHAGGQFNTEPGSYVNALVNIIKEAGADEIVGHHPHVVQKSEWIGDDFFVSYSLGNFSLSPSSIYVPLENLPQYGLMYHMYVEDKKIIKRTFSIIKMVEDENKYLTVYPVSDLYEKVDETEECNLLKDCKIIYERYMDEEFQGDFSIQDEYLIV